MGSIVIVMQLAFYNKAYLKSSYGYKANLKTQQVYILLKSLKVHVSLGSYSTHPALNCRSSTKVDHTEIRRSDSH